MIEVKKYVKEGQVVVAGRVGGLEKKNESLVAVSIANRLNKEETSWEHVAFCNPKDTERFQMAEFAEKYIRVGQYLTVVCNEVINGEYKNLYANAVELGPKSLRQAVES